ncbi:putative Transcriptional regulator domain-containing protein [Candidatus Sulfopaludibacter sp. SbA4]|nr:putative Transcriptional regulator domain-containing protein [Candidatus Sulfopaludibacter sp. SbA4]
MAGRDIFEFAEFMLDPQERRLTRGGEPVALEPKAYDVLAGLVRNAGRLVTKQELLELVWPGAFVEEGILAVHVSSLRKALSDGDRKRRYIETVSRSGYRFVSEVTRRTVERPSLAVLPSVPVSTEIFSARDRSIGLALADAVIDRLGRFPEIVVRPTRAVHTYMHAAEDPAAVGRSLHVDAVIDSHMLRTVQGVRVSAQMLVSEDGERMWSGEFDEAATDFSAIADAVAGSVARHLGLSPAYDSGAARTRGRPELYELFGRGRSHLLAASLYEVPKAVAAFRAAIELEPGYAAAHAGLALACCAQAEFRVAPPAEAYHEAKAAALRALAMDDACADAQVALGAVLFLSEWDWVGAEMSLRRATEINPNHTEAYLLYGRLLEALGRLEAGLAMKLRALERDPFSPLVHLQIAMSYFLQRRYDDSIEWANKTLELDPRHLLAREQLAGAYWKKGDYDRHMAETILHAESYGVPGEALEPLKRAYATGGRAGVVKFVLQSASPQESGARAVMLAVYSGEAGDLDAAFRHLDCAISSHDPALVNLAVGPQWDCLRGDPRYRQCLARMRLPNFS